MYDFGKEELGSIEELFLKKSLFRYQGNDLGECRSFEKELSEKFSSKHSLLVNSGTNALVLALRTLGVSDGDEVIIPCYTFIATALAVKKVGAKVVIAEVDSNLCLDTNAIKSKLSKKTKAVIAVHMDGHPCEMDKIVEFCEAKNLKIVEDTAQAFGGKFKGRYLGTWGDIGCFSFNQDKILTCGEGGACVTSSEELYKKMLGLHDSAIRYNPFYKDYVKEVEPVIGDSMRVSEISGAILRVQLKKFDSILERLKTRKKIMMDVIGESCELIESYDFDGDCGTSLLFKTTDESSVNSISKKLIFMGIKAVPIHLRPAHSYWKWIPLIKEAESFDGNGSRRLIERVLKIDINIELDLDQTHKLALDIKKIIG